MMSREEKLPDDIIKGVIEHGPVVVEHFICEQCGYSEIAIHWFVESIACSACNHRQPSLVEIYKEDGFGG